MSVHDDEDYINEAIGQLAPFLKSKTRPID